MAEHESWATQVGDVTVSTRHRESSALVSDPPRYFETFAFRDGQIIWQSAAMTEDKAQLQHDVAVRWFARALDRPLVDALTVSSAGSDVGEEL